MLAPLCQAAVFVVTLTSDIQPAQNGTLRAAILAANLSPGPDTIKFAIGSGVQTITLTSSLPNITDTVEILGNTQPGYKGRPLIVIDGVSAGSGCVGITLYNHTGSVVRGLNIQRCGTDGMQILSGSGYKILGNFIGTDQTGTLDRGNGEGIFLSGADDVTIGGSKKGEGNVISGNDNPGIYFYSGNRMHVYGNKIGTDVTGLVALPNNGNGVGMADGTGHRIGGSKPGQGNLISGNSSNAIIINGVEDTIIAGNLLGTDITGKAALPNNDGIVALDSTARIGGRKVGERNIISGNSSHGLEISDAAALQIIGNYIGVARDGKTALGNASNGIDAANVTATLQIGAKKGGGNVISANGLAGIKFLNVEGAQIVGNRIGVNAKGKPMGNLEDGMRLAGTTENSTIGSNTVAFNGNYGIILANDAAIQNTLSANAIYANDVRGISLKNNVPLANDSFDIDTGANRHQNYPVIQVTKADGSVSGVLASAMSTQYRIEFFAGENTVSSEYQGKKYLGSTKVETGSNGIGNFKAHLPLPLPKVIIATATNLTTGDTSEFSPGSL